MSEKLLILGAGASRAIGGEQYPLVGDFFNKVYDILGEDEQYRFWLENIEKYFRRKYNLNIYELRGTGFNIEDLFTFLEIEISKQPWNKILEELKIKKALISIISRLFVKLSDGTYRNDSVYDIIRNYVKKYKSMLSVISFNWDLLFDNVFGRNDIIKSFSGEGYYKGNQYYNFIHYISDCRMLFLDYSNKPVIRFVDRPLFLKLHGSIDWKFCPNQDCPAFNKVFPVEYPLKEHRCEHCMETLDVLIIPPILNKQISDFVFIRKLWNIAIEKIRTAREIIIFGYSLPDTDFYTKWLFFKASNRLDKLVIIDPNSEGLVDKFVSIFKLTSKSKNTYCFASFEDYIDWGNFLCRR